MNILLLLGGGVGFDRGRISEYFIDFGTRVG